MGGMRHTRNVECKCMARRAVATRNARMCKQSRKVRYQMRCIAQARWRVRYANGANMTTDERRCRSAAATAPVVDSSTDGVAKEHCARRLIGWGGRAVIFCRVSIITEFVIMRHVNAGADAACLCRRFVVRLPRVFFFFFFSGRLLCNYRMRRVQLRVPCFGV